jgi:transposase
MKLRRSRLSTEQTQRLLEHFVAGTPARTSAELVGVNRNTATYFYHRLRELIAARLDALSPLGARAVAGPASSRKSKDEAGAGSRGSVTIVRLLQHDGKVYTALLPSSRRDALSTALRSGSAPDSILVAETLDLHARLDVPGRRRQRAKRSDRGKPGQSSIGGVENYWRQALRNLRKYNGVPAHHLPLFLKECEWRFNYGSPKQLLETLDRWIKEAL